MPRKKVTTITEMIPGDGEPTQTTPTGADLQPTEDVEFSERLTAIREQLGGNSDGILIKVYRVVAGKSPAYCFESRGDVNEDMILRRTRRGGTYQCNVVVGGRVVDTIEVEIDEHAIPPEESTAKASASTNPADTVLQLVMQQNAQLMAMFGNFMQSMANGGNQNQLTTPQIIAMLKDMKDLAGGNGEGTAMKMFEKGIDMAARIGGFGEKSIVSEILDTAKDVIKPALPAIVSHFSKANGSVPALPPMNPNPTEQPMEPTAATPEQTRERVKQAIAQMKSHAMANTPVSLVLDWILAHAHQYTDIVNSIVTQDFKSLVEIDPTIANEPLSTWFKNLYDGLRSAYNQSATVDDDSDGEDGDAGDFDDDENPSLTVVPQSGNSKTRDVSRKRNSN